MRILIAEDDLTARMILSAILKKWGYEVLAVNDGLAAWQVLQQSDAPRLVILDWLMPGLSGPEVIRMVRASSDEPLPYIIFLTSKDEKSDIVAGLETGANDYVKKPFDNDELFARIKVGQRSVELQTRLFEAQQNLAHLAMHDALTGILNRRAILEQLAKDLARYQRKTTSILDQANHSPSAAKPAPGAQGCALGYIDIDNFKLINDRYGHKVGDEILKGFVQALNNQLRSYDSLGRLGGDEFLVIVPDIDEDNSRLVFERLQAAGANFSVLTEAGKVTIEASIGVALARPGQDVDHFLESADSAMYLAKRSGGNRVSFSL
jgi:diguanylate cyclase (GGDEF)-like protein